MHPQQRGDETRQPEGALLAEQGGGEPLRNEDVDLHVLGVVAGRTHAAERRGRAARQAGEPREVVEGGAGRAEAEAPSLYDFLELTMNGEDTLLYAPHRIKPSVALQVHAHAALLAHPPQVLPAAPHDLARLLRGQHDRGGARLLAGVGPADHQREGLYDLLDVADEFDSLGLVCAHSGLMHHHSAAGGLLDLPGPSASSAHHPRDAADRYEKADTVRAHHADGPRSRQLQTLW